jgi:hypothetical protein
MSVVRYELADAITTDTHHLRGCTGKAPIPRGVAGLVARRMRDRHGKPLTSYACPHCGGWHVGGKHYAPTSGENK